MSYQPIALVTFLFLFGCQNQIEGNLIILNETVGSKNVVYKTNRALIYLAIDDVEKSSLLFLEKHPHVKERKQFLNYAKNELTQMDSIVVQHEENATGINEQMKYVTYELLKQGKGRIYNRQSEKWERTILEEEYEGVTSGSRFYLKNGKEFLDVRISIK